MLGKLSNNPDELFRTIDDSEAKLLMMEAGMPNLFEKVVPGVKATTQFSSGQCATHYLLVMFFTGRTVQTDNGYFLMAWPKSKTTLVQLYLDMAELFNGMGIKEADVMAIRFPRLDSN